MCGIAGLISSTTLSGHQAQPVREDELRRMIASLHHRGPDGSDVRVEGGVGLAHARLSIIDLATGWQPMHNEDESVWVVFNGEIFNYLELRADLQRRGHRFYTHSDTEVLVHLYEEFGERFVEHLNGQFAIALHDTRLRRVVLARDRVGIRPLFYAQIGARLAFASEIKALFTLPGMRRAFDTRALADIFTLWSAVPPCSAFEGVSQLPPGHVMVVDLPTDGGAIRTRISRYWDWEFPTLEQALAAPHRSEDDCAEELKALLIDAVRLQLRADVPVGAYLSGGLDSSIITSLIRNHTNTPLRTFSLTFEDAEFDESVWQQELVEHLRTEHSSLKASRSDIAAGFPRAVWHVETPIVRTAPTPLMLLSGLVRESGYKVVLTGEGADEVFGGYDLFKEAKIRRFLAREPNSSWRPRILEKLYPYLKNSPASGRAFTHRFFGEGMDQLHEPWFSHVPRMTTTQRVQQFFNADVQAQLRGYKTTEALRERLPGALAGWAPMHRDQYVEAHTLMSGYLLSSQGDRVAMASSVEGRVPFLDHRLIEFASRLPPQYKLKGLTEKHLLKHAMRGELPESIRRRTKQPYRAPDSACFFERGKAVDYVAELMSPQRIAQAGIFDPLAVNKLFEKSRAGRAIGFGDNMAFVGVLSTQLLHEQFIQPKQVKADSSLATTP